MRSSSACAVPGGAAPCAAAGHGRACGEATHLRRALPGAALASWRLGNTCGDACIVVGGSDGQRGAASARIPTSGKRDATRKFGVRRGRRSGAAALLDSAGCLCLTRSYPKDAVLGAMQEDCMHSAPAPPRRHGNHFPRLKPVRTNCYASANASNTAALDGEPLSRTRRKAALRPMRTALAMY